MILNCMSCYRPVGFEYFTLSPTIEGVRQPLITEQGGYLCLECVKAIRIAAASEKVAKISTGKGQRWRPGGVIARGASAS